MGNDSTWDHRSVSWKCFSVQASFIHPFIQPINISLLLRECNGATDTDTMPIPMTKSRMFCVTVCKKTCAKVAILHAWSPPIISCSIILTIIQRTKLAQRRTSSRVRGQLLVYQSLWLPPWLSTITSLCSSSYLARPLTPPAFSRLHTCVFALNLGL